MLPTRFAEMCGSPEDSPAAGPAGNSFKAPRTLRRKPLDVTGARDGADLSGRGIGERGAPADAVAAGNACAPEL